jgi:hypothetical protein
VNCPNRIIARSVLLLPALLLLVCFLWTGAAVADEASPAVAPEDIALLPLDETEWLRVSRDRPDLIQRLQLLGKRAERVKAHLASRADPNDAGSRKLAAELVRIRDAFAPLIAELLDVVRPLGIDDAVLASLRDAPQGPMREERQAVRLVLRVPELTDDQRRLHARLGPAVEGALVGLRIQKRRLQELVAHEEEGLDADTIRRAMAQLDAQAEALQKRFWRVVDATLDPAQRVALRRRLPTKLTKLRDALGHLFLLPGLTTSQGARLQSLLVRMDAESAADKALIARIQAQFAEGDLSGPERRDLQRQKREADARQADLLLASVEEGRAILTPEQYAAFRAVPPMLTAQERGADLKDVLDAIALRPDQVEALREIRREYGPVRGEMMQRMAAIALQAEEYGPDSPQREMMQMMRYQVFADGLAAARAAAAELFREVLTPDQVMGWVLGVEKDT